MPNDVPSIVTGKFTDKAGRVHFVPSYADEKNPKMATPMSGHLFYGPCCYKKSVKQSGKEIAVVHSIIH